MPYYGILTTLPASIHHPLTTLGQAIPDGLGSIGCYSSETRWTSQE